MKKILIALLTMLSFSLNYGQTNATVPSGSGTEADPYQIATLENLSWLAQADSLWGKFYIQTADIDASTTVYWDDVDENGDGDKYNDPSDVTADSSNDGWPGIGTFEVIDFTGSYDGQGFTIDGVVMNRPTEKFKGFFGGVSTGSIKNLGLTNINFTFDSFAGGLVGANEGDAFLLDSCYTTGTLAVDDGYVVGGLVGYLGRRGDGGTVQNSYSEVDVTSNLIQYAGGLVGLVKAGVVTRCYTTGTITGAKKYQGGLIGEIQKGTVVSECYSKATVAGILGSEGYYGVLIGSIREAKVSNSYTSGEVTGGATLAPVGAFVGQDKLGTIEYCYSVGVNTIDKSRGFLGNINTPGTYTSNFVDTTASGCSTVMGAATGKTTSEMKIGSTFLDAGWDLISTWEVNDNYPNLRKNSNSDLSGGNSGTVVNMTPPEGSGTYADPYKIATLGNLSWLTQTDSVLNKFFIQVADINASTTAYWDDIDENGDGDRYNDANDITLGGNNEGWKAIGLKDSSIFFEGNYFGEGFVIDSLTINRPGETNQALFGAIRYGTLEKLGLTNIKYNCDSYSGGLVAFCDENTIDSCYVTGSIVAQGVIKPWAVGGFAAYIGYDKIGTKITNSHSDVDITCINGINLAGGFVGYAKGVCSISKCYALGDLTGVGTSSGPFVGKLLDSKASECYSTGNITTKESGSDAISAFIGDNYRSIISNCYSTGSLSGKAFTVEEGHKYYYSQGGFVGRNTSPCTIEYCYATGKNNIYPSRGFVGNLQIKPQAFVYTSNYLDTTTSGCTQVELGGQTVVFEKTTAEMKTKSTYADWDFSKYWRIEEGNYPTLRMGDIEVGVERGELNMLPKRYALHQNYPNPFNPSTVISFDLPKAGNTELSIYNILGQKVATLVNQEMNAGTYKYTFDARNISSGIYFYKLTSNNYSKVSKMMLLK